MTVLFCDLAGSTSMAGSIGDEAMFALIRDYQDICNQVTAEHGGYVAKYMGDGMLAYFGYPDAMKNSAAQAVSAALQIIRQTSQITLPDGSGLTASAGVATGWMVVGDAHASAAAAEVMAIGSTVNLAARLQAEAGPGQVAVSSGTSQRLSPERFALSRLGVRPIKGFAEPLEIWLAGEAGAAAPPAVFVGREKLQKALGEAWTTASSGEVTFAGIVAPGGYGKTALARAFMKATVDESNVIFLHGEAHRSEQGFAAFRGLVRELAGISTAEPAGQQRATLQDWAPEGAAEGLAMLCGLHLEEVPPLVRTARIGQALRDTLVRRLPQHPAVLFADDAHWLDPDSVRLMAELPDLLGPRPLLVLVTRRPEGAAVPVPEHFSITLDTMGDREAAGLVAALDSKGIIGEAARTRIIGQAGGVPLFLEHITRAVLERPDHKVDDAVPVTMIEALHERFSHLGDALPLVESAAVLGRQLRVDVLADMLGSGEDAVSQQVSRLIGRGLFRLRSSGKVAFDHALIREAVLDTLLKPKLRSLHETALSAYETARPGHLAADPVRAATHLMGAGREAEAIPNLLAASQAALMRGEISEAVRLLRWADGGLDAVPEDSGLRNGLEMAVQFSLGLAMVQHRGFSDEAVAEAYERAMELCTAGEGGSESEFQIAWGIWAHYMVTGGTGRALQMTARMSNIAEQNPELEVLAASARSLVLCNQGKLKEQEAAAARVDALYNPEIHRMHGLTYSMDSLEMAHLFRIHGRWIAGDLPGWRAAFDAARSHEAFLDLPILQPYVRIYSLAPNTYALPHEDCREELEAAIAFAQDIGQPFWVTAGHVWLAHEAVRSRGPVEALEEMRAAVEMMEVIGLQLGRAYHDAMLAYCSACSGARKEARAMISRAKNAIAAGRDQLYAPEVLRLSAETLLACDPDQAQAAQTELNEAAARAEAQGSYAWAALTAASQARLSAVSSGRAAAEARLSEDLKRLVRPESSSHPAFLSAGRAFDHPI
jgi:class 3 adenylate cyclase